MPTIQELEARAVCPSGYYYSNGKCYADSAWYWWGRWVLAGAVVLFVIFIFVILGCISARRRRRRGLYPMYGTGWMAPPGKYGEQGQYPPQQQWGGGSGPQQYGMQPQHGPPNFGGQENQYQYGPQQGIVNPQYSGTTFQPSDGYYGGHHEGVQLQSPPNTYQPVYSPPAGPPPQK